MEIYNVVSFDPDARTPLTMREELADRFRMLNCFLSYCELHDRFSSDAYAEKLLERLRWRSGPVGALPFSWCEIPEGPLRRFPDLAQGMVRFLVSAFDLASTLGELSDGLQSEIPTSAYLRGSLHLRFLMAEALDEFMPRTSAIEFFKSFVDFHTVATQPSVPDVLELSDRVNDRPPFQGSFDRVRFRCGAGKWGAYVTRCRWHETLAEFGDPERAYAVACHYDFVAARRLGRNISLTRTSTVMQGGVCDFIWHDSRLSDGVHEALWEEARAALLPQPERREISP